MADRDPLVWDDAASILAAVKDVPMERRIDAFSLATAAVVQTDFTLEVRDGTE